MSYHYIHWFKTEIHFELSKTLFQMPLAFSLQMLANLCVVWYTQAKRNKPIKAAINSRQLNLYKFFNILYVYKDNFLSSALTHCFLCLNQIAVAFWHPDNTVQRCQNWISKAKCFRKRTSLQMGCLFQATCWAFVYNALQKRWMVGLSLSGTVDHTFLVSYGTG